MPALSISRTALLVALGTAVTLGIAYYFQYVLGYRPCALCMLQRWGYYIGLPLALVAAFTGRREVLILAALVFAITAFGGLYHAGIEWKFWPGPATCSAGAGAFGGNLMDSLQNTRIVPCDSAPWRFLGLSFAGWSMVICAALSALAFSGARRG